MKTLKFDTKSWHWYLASDVGNYRPSRHGENLCAYSRRVLLGAIKVLGASVIVAALVAVVGYLLWNVIFGIIFSIMLHTWMFTDEAMAVLILAGVGTVAVLLITGFKLTSYALSRGAQAARAATIEKPDSFAANAYNAWHDKFCAKLEFVNHDGDE